jgi:CarD family transcriptional regulator
MRLYKTDDYVLCREGGVWKVLNIDDKKIFLKQHDSGEEKTIPLNNNNEIVRSVASKESILSAIDRVGFIPTIQAANDKARRILYEDAMKKYEEIEWIKVIKSIYFRKKDGRLMPGEEECAERAKNYFYGEISVVLGIMVSEVENYISTAVSNDKL